VKVVTVGDLLERLGSLEEELWDVLEAAETTDAGTYFCPKTRRRWRALLERPCCICHEKMTSKPQAGMCPDCFERYSELQQEIAEGCV
jgi:hypothetical protein